MVQTSVVTLATILRTIGATTNTIGKAISQDDAQLAIQAPKNPSERLNTRTVDTPETINDMNPESRNPKRTGANLGDMLTQPD